VRKNFIQDMAQQKKTHYRIHLKLDEAQLRLGETYWSQRSSVGMTRTAGQCDDDDEMKGCTAREGMYSNLWIWGEVDRRVPVCFNLGG
jgi:hypothetical protein